MLGISLGACIALDSQFIRPACDACDRSDSGERAQQLEGTTNGNTMQSICGWGYNGGQCGEVQRWSMWGGHNHWRAQQMAIPCNQYADWWAQQMAIPCCNNWRAQQMAIPCNQYADRWAQQMAIPCSQYADGGATVGNYSLGKCSVAVMAPTLAQSVVVSGCRPRRRGTALW
eukprot:5169752-Pyramimonas_sp.AAC.1